MVDQPDGESCYLFLTRHARKRMWQRRISREAILACLMYGSRSQSPGRIYFELRRHQIPPNSGIDIGRNLGIGIVASPDGAILTVYRLRKHCPVRRAQWRRWR